MRKLSKLFILFLLTTFTAQANTPEGYWSDDCDAWFNLERGAIPINLSTKTIFSIQPLIDIEIRSIEENDLVKIFYLRVVESRGNSRLRIPFSNISTEKSIATINKNGKFEWFGLYDINQKRYTYTDEIDVFSVSPKVKTGIKNKHMLQIQKCEILDD